MVKVAPFFDSRCS